MITTILDLMGIALVVTGFGVVLGLGAALLAAGAASLALSWAISTRGGSRS